MARKVKGRLGPLAWGALVVFVISRLGDVANLGSRLFLGRSLTAVDFGAIEPALSTLSLLSWPIGVVFPIAVKSISRLRATGREDACRALVADLAKLALAGSVVALVIVALARGFILSRLHLQSDVYVYLIAALFVLSWWQPLCGAIIQGAQSYRIMAVSSIFNPFLLLLLTLLFVAALPWGLAGALLARVCAGLATTLVMLFFLRSFIVGRRASYADEWPTMRAMLFPMAVFVAGTTLLGTFDRLLVRNFFLADSGGYGAVVTLGAVPGYLIGPLSFVLFPMAAAEHASGRDLKRLLLRTVGVAVVSAALCAIGFALIGARLMAFWNAAFVPYSGYLWMSALIAGLGGAIQMVVSVEFARHRYRFLAFVVVPTVLMCGVLYAIRSSLTIGGVLAAVLTTHAVILAGVLAVSLRDGRE